MNWSDGSQTDATEENLESVPSTLQEMRPELSQALYQGDHGELTLDTRRALVQLLSGPSLEGRRHSKLWPTLLLHEDILRKRLSDLFLELVVDHDAQIAFTRQANAESVDIPLLLRRYPLTFIDSVVLLMLRQRLTQANAHGERAVVSLEEIMNDLSVYERSGNTDRAGFVKKVKASVEKFKTHSILQKIRSSEDRFEVSPTLKLLFSADRIEALTKLYRAMGTVDDAEQEGNGPSEQQSDPGEEISC